MNTATGKGKTVDGVSPDGRITAMPYGDYPSNWTPTARTARMAGVLWILMSISGAFSMIFVRGKLVVTGDILATAGNIVSHELLLRFGFICDLVMMVLLLATAIVLYRLFYTIEKNLAALMVLLAALGSAIGMLNCLNELAPLRLLGMSEGTNIFEAGQLEAQAMLYLQAYEDGYVVAQVFFVLWVLPLGLLIYRSGFLPKAFGVLFVIETTFGLAGSFAYFLFPGWGIEEIMLAPGAFAEISFMFWLAIKGIDEAKVKDV